MAIENGYLARNLLHAKAVGVLANASSTLARLEKMRKPPRWLVVALQGIIQRAGPVSEEMAKHRDELSPYQEEKLAVCPLCGDTKRTCEHRCYACDRIVSNGTCNNGFCENCVSVEYS